MRLTILIRGAAPILCGLLVLGTAACSDPLFDFENSGILDVTDTGPEELPLFLGEPVGGECTEDSDCRDGLVCENDACEPARAKAMNKRCLLSEECAEGLHCGLSGFCVTAGTLDEGAECASSSECMPTMFCEFAGGLTGVCVAHTTKNPKDIGGTCGGTVDCRAGLVCSQSEAFGGTCVAGSLLMNPDLFKGEACERAQDEEAMGFGVRMKVPRGEDVEFYAFPFPSDIHLTDGKVELDGHERPGPGFIGFDTPAAIIDAIEDEMDGFALTPAIFFRFSRAVDPESLAGNVHLIDLDAGTKIDDATLELSFQAERNKYICRNYLYVHPRWSEPLKPGTTYGVYVSADVKEAVAEGGEAGEVKQLDDLDTLLSAEAPSSDTLKVAWESMKPLRAYLGKEKIKLSRVLGATVFTTRSGATTRMEQFAELSKTLGMPEIVADSVTVCDPKEHTASPCATADWELTEKGQAGFDDPRGCPNPNPSDEAKAAGEINPYPPGVIEVHAKVRLPIFQKGEPPYMQGGGDIKVEDGKPVEVRKEEVCVSLSLPLGEMPAGGWPLIIYGHGTGGSFRRGTQLLGTLASCIDTEN